MNKRRYISDRFETRRSNKALRIPDDVRSSHRATGTPDTTENAAMNFSRAMPAAPDILSVNNPFFS
jgi:hypothetical protein